MRSRSSEFAESLAEAPIVAILRGITPEETKHSIQQVWNSSAKVVEIPLHSKYSVDAFLAATEMERPSNKHFLGIGTVRSLEDLQLAHELGADFTVAPSLNLDVIEASKASQIHHIPGVCSPSEIALAIEQGVSLMKLFPASLYGPKGLQALLGPFSDARFVAVGGVDVSSAHDYLAAGAVAVGIGSALTDDSANLSQLATVISKSNTREN